LKVIIIIQRRDRETDRQTDRQTERQTDRDRDRRHGITSKNNPGNKVLLR